MDLDPVWAFLADFFSRLPPTLKVEVSTGLAVLAVVAVGLWGWSRRGRPD